MKVYSRKENKSLRIIILSFLLIYMLSIAYPLVEMLYVLNIKHKIVEREFYTNVLKNFGLSKEKYIKNLTFTIYSTLFEYLRIANQSLFISSILFFIFYYQRIFLKTKKIFEISSFTYKLLDYFPGDANTQQNMAFCSLIFGLYIILLFNHYFSSFLFKGILTISAFLFSFFASYAFIFFGEISIFYFGCLFLLSKFISTYLNLQPGHKVDKSYKILDYKYLYGQKVADFFAKNEAYIPIIFRKIDPKSVRVGGSGTSVGKSFSSSPPEIYLIASNQRFFYGINGSELIHEMNHSLEGNLGNIFSKNGLIYLFIFVISLLLPIGIISLLFYYSNNCVSKTDGDIIKFISGFCGVVSLYKDSPFSPLLVFIKNILEMSCEIRSDFLSAKLLGNRNTSVFFAIYLQLSHFPSMTAPLSLYTNSFFDVHPFLEKRLQIILNNKDSI